MTSAYRTEIKIVVYSNEPLPDDWPAIDLWEPVSTLIYEMTEGDMIGDWSMGPSAPIEGDELRRELIAIGNDGDFFETES